MPMRILREKSIIGGARSIVYSACPWMAGSLALRILLIPVALLRALRACSAKSIPYHSKASSAGIRISMETWQSCCRSLPFWEHTKELALRFLQKAFCKNRNASSFVCSQNGRLLQQLCQVSIEIRIPADEAFEWYGIDFALHARSARKSATGIKRIR